MRLKIKPNKEIPVTYVEYEPEPNSDVNSLMMNVYAVSRLRKEALHKIKASLHAYADSLIEEDLEIL